MVRQYTTFGQNKIKSCGLRVSGYALFDPGIEV